jgi:hypothetical protein
LPIELRLKIWKLNLPGPRMVDVAFKKGPDPKFLVNHPPPTNLSICKESRQEALKKYTLMLGASRIKSDHWIDPVNDTVMFCISLHPNFHGWNWDYREKIHFLIGDEAKATLQNVAIDAFSLPNHRYDMFESFKALRGLTFVLHGNDEGKARDWWHDDCKYWRSRSWDTELHPAPEAYLRDEHSLPLKLLRAHARHLEWNPAYHVPKPTFLVVDEKRHGGAVAGRG